MNTKHLHDVRNLLLAWILCAVGATSAIAADCIGVNASADDGNIALNVTDNNLATRWSANGDNQWIRICANPSKKAIGVELAFFRGDLRTANFDLQVSDDGVNWITVAANLVSSGNSLNKQFFSFPAQSTRFVRMLGHGNSANTWNSLTKMSLVESASQQPLPAAWTSVDVGNTAPSTLSYSNKTFTSNTPAHDIWSTVDQFHFVYQKLTGDSTITTRINSLQNSNEWAKAGLMMRDNLSDNAQNVAMTLTALNGVAFQHRATTGGQSISTELAGPSAPHWLRLVRKGDLFTGYSSADGITWLQIASITLSINKTIYVGMVHSSHAYGAFGQASFNKVTVNNAPPTIPPPIPGQAKYPFPQSLNYVGTIKPSHVTQDSLNADVKAYYDYWKAKYVMPSNGNTPGGGYFVKADSTGGAAFPIKSNSEAHGYGMMIFALMNNREYFDGMYNMYDKHRSKINSHLMSWIITVDEYTSQDSDSASDGDMDVAYALILADVQWGSAGKVNYLSEAKRIINNGLKQSDFSLTSYRSMLGDWDTNQYTTRSSDWITDHMAAYYHVTKDRFWLSARDTTYGLIQSITTNHSQTTGLMPDFVIGQQPVPAPPNFLEAATDGDYSWNACRFPWRMAVDYAHFGNKQSRQALLKIMSWVSTKTGGEPSKIVGGYTLSGNALVSYSDSAFTSPFVAGAIVNKSHQQFLNKGWSLMRNDYNSYYGDSINLLTMLLISGNWWNPVP